MPQPIKEVMTRNPVTLPAGAHLTEAARKMRESNIGDVVVSDGDGICGIVTDRDIVVRALADGRTDAQLGEICSRDLVTVSPDDDVKDVARLLNDKALRRVVVMRDGKLEGIVSLGDLAIERDRKSVLAGISAAPPNK